MSSMLKILIGEVGLGAHLDALVAMSRPSIELTTIQSPIIPGCSKFGGIPDLPGSFVWPQHALGDYRFIGQVNCAELPSGVSLLPRTGLLSFFYAHDKDGETFWGDPGYVRAFHFDTNDEIRAFNPPKSVALGASCRLGFETNSDVPRWPSDKNSLKDWPIDESLRDEYWDLRCLLHPSRRYLLGFPFNTTLGYDPTPGPEWQSLLTLASDDDFEWYWHDGDWLVTFIERSKLQQGDFSEIRADAG